MEAPNSNFGQWVFLEIGKTYKFTWSDGFLRYHKIIERDKCYRITKEGKIEYRIAEHGEDDIENQHYLMPNDINIELSEENQFELDLKDLINE